MRAQTAEDDPDWGFLGIPPSSLVDRVQDTRRFTNQIKKQGQVKRLIHKLFKRSDRKSGSGDQDVGR